MNIRFININTGRTYNGDKPYVSWFDDQQSVNMIYVQKLCIFSDTADLDIFLPMSSVDDTDNDIFSLIDPSRIMIGDTMVTNNTVMLDQLTYMDLDKLKTNIVRSEGTPYADQGYVHMIYIMATCPVELEATQSFYIRPTVIDTVAFDITADSVQEFTIGASFHDAKEELKIGLGNNGVELPESIQKAIYPSNVHEEKNDAILMNRKYKELLMNYVDTLGNKGSYQSLLNSLKWFEYGDLVNIREFWKHNVLGHTIYEDQNFKQVIADRTRSILSNYAKTTYMGLYCALNEHTGDIEKQLYPDILKGTFHRDVVDATGLTAAPSGLSMNPSLADIKAITTDIVGNDSIRFIYNTDGGYSYVDYTVTTTVVDGEVNIQKVWSVSPLAYGAWLDVVVGGYIYYIKDVEGALLQWKNASSEELFDLGSGVRQVYQIGIDTDAVSPFEFESGTINESSDILSPAGAVVYTSDPLEQSTDGVNIVTTTGTTSNRYMMYTLFVGEKNQSISINITDNANIHRLPIFGFAMKTDVADGMRLTNITPLNTKSLGFENFVLPVNASIVVLCTRTTDPLFENNISGEVIVTTPYSGDDTTSTHSFSGTDITRVDSVYKDRHRIISEQNPELSLATLKWSRNDMSIKMALLGNFYETYFMPVHVDLIHSTIEDIVYTNTTKIISDACITRTDHIIQGVQIGCNVKNGDIFYVGDVKVQANSGTPFVRIWDSTTDTYTSHSIVGVGDTDGSQVIDIDGVTTCYAGVPAAHMTNVIATDDDNDQSKLLDDEIKTILLNSYTGVGVVIPFVFTIPAKEGEVITKSILSYESDTTKTWENIVNEKIFTVQPSGDIIIKFNMLCTRDRDYDIRIGFYGNNGHTYVKRVTFTTVDTRRAKLDVYKIKSVRPVVGRSYNQFMFGHTFHSDLDDVHKFYTQFIPVNPDLLDSSDSGVKLKMMVVIKDNFTWHEGVESVKHTVENILLNRFPTQLSILDKIRNMKALSNNEIISLQVSAYHIPVQESRVLTAWIMLLNYFDVSSMVAPNGNTYYMFIAQRFNFRDSSDNINALARYFYDRFGYNNAIIRNDMVYVPQAHYLERLDRTDIKTLSIRPTETLAVIPNVKFLRNIDAYEWTFRNASTLKEYNLPSIKEPFVASNDPNRPQLDPGFYDIIFRYKLTSERDDLVDTNQSKNKIIIDGYTYYIHCAWCNTINNTDESFIISKVSGLDFKYIGIAVTAHEEDPVEFNDYAWRSIYTNYNGLGFSVGMTGGTIDKMMSVAWCNTFNNSDNSFTTSKIAGRSYKYIGICIASSSLDSRIFDDYEWFALDDVDTNIGYELAIDGTTYFIHLAWCDNKLNSNNSFSKTKQKDILKAYIGINIGTSRNDPDNFGDYTWISTKSVLEEPKPQSIHLYDTYKPRYIHFAWCNRVSDGKDFTVRKGPLSEYKYIGIYISDNEQSPIDKDKYAWIYIREEIHEVTLSSAFIQLSDDPNNDINVLVNNYMIPDYTKTVGSQIESATFNARIGLGKYSPTFMESRTMLPDNLLIRPEESI